MFHQGVHLVDGVVEDVDAALLVACGLGVVPGAGGVEAHHAEDLALVVGLLHAREKVGLGLGGGLGGLVGGVDGILGACAAGGEGEQHESRQDGGDQAFQVGHGGLLDPKMGGTRKGYRLQYSMDGGICQEKNL